MYIVILGELGERFSGVIVADDFNDLRFGEAPYPHLGPPSWPFRPGIHRFRWIPTQDARQDHPRNDLRRDRFV